MAEKYAWGPDPDHPILDRAFEWEIVGLNLDMLASEDKEAHLDLVLHRAQERCVLRFWSPTELEIEKGGPSRTGGLVILDISSRQLSNLGVRVDDVESSPGASAFSRPSRRKARRVVRHRSSSLPARSFAARCPTLPCRVMCHKPANKALELTGLCTFEAW